MEQVEKTHIMIWPTSVSGVLILQVQARKQRCSEDPLRLNYQCEDKGPSRNLAKISDKHKTNQTDNSRSDICIIESLNTTQITIWPTPRWLDPRVLQLYQTAKLSSCLNVRATKG